MRNFTRLCISWLRGTLIIYCANIRIDNTHLHKLDIVLLKSRTALMKGVGFYFALPLFYLFFFYMYIKNSIPLKTVIGNLVYENIGCYVSQQRSYRTDYKIGLYILSSLLLLFYEDVWFYTTKKLCKEDCLPDKAFDLTQKPYWENCLHAA